MEFKRSLIVQEYNSWLQLRDSLQGVNLDHDANDFVTWALEKKGHYTTKSLYRFLIIGGHQ